MIKDPISITVYNSYDISMWEKEVVRRCIVDNPTSTHEELAKLLGISPKSLYRKSEDYNLNLSSKARKSEFKTAEILRKLQYT